MLKTDSLNFESKKEIILNFILKKNILKKKEVELINSLEIFPGEF